MSFFEPPPAPEPVTPEQFEVPEWYGPPHGVLGGVVPLELLFARSEKAAVVIESATVYLGDVGVHPGDWRSTGCGAVVTRNGLGARELPARLGVGQRATLIPPAGWNI